MTDRDRLVVLDGLGKNDWMLQLGETHEILRSRVQGMNDLLQTTWSSEQENKQKRRDGRDHQEGKSQFERVEIL